METKMSGYKSSSVVEVPSTYLQDCRKKKNFVSVTASVYFINFFISFHSSLDKFASLFLMEQDKKVSLFALNPSVPLNLVW